MHDNGRSPEAKRVATLAMAALGVVYGDIGTSPLYAIRECFFGPHGVEPSRANVLGALSLIFWTLVVVVTLKYLVYVLRADNRGEGGILALMALGLGDTQMGHTLLCVPFVCPRDGASPGFTAPSPSPSDIAR